MKISSGGVSCAMAWDSSVWESIVVVMNSRVWARWGLCMYSYSTCTIAPERVEYWIRNY